ncbi:MAG: anthranilate synthase component I family protein [Methanoregula sp.]|jgi:anthranilate synthase component 1
MDGDAGGLEIATIKKELNLNLGFNEYLTAVREQPKPLIIPLCAQLPFPRCTPEDVFSATRAGNGFLLESLEGSEKCAQYSYIGMNPACTITIGNGVQITGDDIFIAIAREPEGENPVDQIRSILSRFHYVNQKAPRFFGGLVGYFAYDIIHDLFPQVPRNGNRSGQKTPDARFMLTKDCIVFDHRDRKLYIFSSPFLTYESDPEEEYRRCAHNIALLAGKIVTLSCRGIPEKTSFPSPRNVPPDFMDISGKEAFEHSVETVQEHIKAGDIFQAVISRKIECAVGADPFPIYTALREINPSPYMYFLDFGDEQVIGASPEMLVRVEKRQVTTVPIAGTRPRGRDKTEDNLFSRELLLDEKERAEHTMLVDLARNDIGRVCKFGSVEVKGFMGIEKFSHVQHMVSTVQGQLQENRDCYDAFKSCFPAGTVSGAPKIRAMQIISDMEPDIRGLYAGAVGFIGFDRNLEFAIAIRSVSVHNGRASIQVGAGIVADSVPAHEWTETTNKAAAMMRALEHSGVSL